jgi:ABC-type enterobactin transport system permease subunit
MLEVLPLAKAPAVVNVVPVAILVIVALWVARRLARAAAFLFLAAAAVGGYLWFRGGL